MSRYEGHSASIGALPSGALSTGVAYAGSVSFSNASTHQGQAVSELFRVLFDVSWPGGGLARQTWDAGIVAAGGSINHNFAFTLPSSANNQTITLTATVVTIDGTVVAATQQQTNCGQSVTIYPGNINWRSSGQMLGFGAQDGIVVPFNDYVTVSPMWVNIGGAAITGSVVAYVTAPSGTQVQYNPNGNSPYTLAPGAAVYVSFSYFRNPQVGTYRVWFRLLVGGVMISETSYTFISSY